jgi:hypothetical protein
VLGLAGEAVGQRFTALEDSDDVLYDDLERGSLGEFAGDGECPVERDAGVEQRRQLLREAGGRRGDFRGRENGFLNSNDFFASTPT